MERYLRRRDASRPEGDEALFAKRCDEFERENPAILEYYEMKIKGRVLEVSRHLFFLDCIYALVLAFCELHSSSVFNQVDVGSLRGIEHTYSTLKESLLRHRHSP